MTKVPVVVVMVTTLMLSACNRSAKRPATPEEKQVQAVRPVPAEVGYTSKKPSSENPLATAALTWLCQQLEELTLQLVPTAASYTSLKDIYLDGDKARSKRARVTGTVREISTDFSIYTGGGALFLSLSFTGKEKPLLHKLNNNDRVVVDFLIEDPSAKGTDKMGRLLDVKAIGVSHSPPQKDSIRSKRHR